MEGALETGTTAAALTPNASWRVGLAPPRVELPPFTRGELDAWFRGGEVAADDCERLLAWAARAAGALDVAIGEGLHALRQGDRLAQLAGHLDDYAREVLDLGRRAAENLARLGRALRTRPLLREALRAGRVRLRAAETVLPVAEGDAEAVWVERAASQTVRELEQAVRRARAGAEEDDDEWLQLRTHLPQEERAVLDASLGLAAELMPGSSRADHTSSATARMRCGGAASPLSSGSRGSGSTSRSGCSCPPARWSSAPPWRSACGRRRPSRRRAGSASRTRGCGC